MRSRASDERQFFYLGRIRRWSFAQRCGPEFSEDGRGEYLPEEMPRTFDALRMIDLRPEQIATVLSGAVERGNLLALPDLRE